MKNSRITREETDILVENMKQCFIFPSPTMLKIKTFEQEHKKAISNKYHGFIEIFECGYELLTELIERANYVEKPNWPFHRTIQFLLLKNSLYPLYSSFDRFEKGFYDDAVILLRTSYETFIRILYLSYHPEDPYIIFQSKPKKGKRKFNLRNFLEHTLKVDWKFFYSYMSAYSHSYAPRTIREAVEISQNGQKVPICLTLKFDEDNASRPMNITFFLLWGLIKLSIILFFNCQQHSFDEKFKEKVEISEKALGAIISRMDNKIATTCGDVNRICDEVLNREMEAYLEQGRCH